MSKQLLTKGAGHVTNVALGELNRNREFTAVDNVTVQEKTWEEFFGPKKSIDFVIPGTGHLAYVVFDAPNATVAAAWLADAGGAGTDAQRWVIGSKDVVPDAANHFDISRDLFGNEVELSTVYIINSTATPIPNIYLSGE